MKSLGSGQAAKDSLQHRLDIQIQRLKALEQNAVVERKLYTAEVLKDSWKLMKVIRSGMDIE
jgi:DNA-binding HxlR family transcriptional regulator